NNGTGVLLLSDVFGFEDSATRDFAYRVACHGYNVLVPDLFRGSPWKKAEKDGFDAWLAGHAPERVSGDIDACTNWLVDEFTAAGVSRKLGIIGFCYGGGRLVETLARDGGGGGGAYSAGVCFYGSRMDASLAPRLAAPVLFVCGDGDPLCGVETVRALEARARGARAAVYAGRGHGFAHRPQSLEDDGDAEDAFALMRGWLHDHLLA
ncbi:Os05g0429500, partial [Oryza sativa Japonica Group]